MEGEADARQVLAAVLHDRLVAQLEARVDAGMRIEIEVTAGEQRAGGQRQIEPRLFDADAADADVKAVKF